MNTFNYCFCVLLLCVAFQLVALSSVDHAKAKLFQPDLRILKASEYAIFHLSSNETFGLPCSRAWRLDKVQGITLLDTVIGTKYRLTFQLKPSKCPKQQHQRGSANKLLCEVTVREHLWDLVNPYAVTQHECRPWQESIQRKPGHDRVATGDLELFRKFTSSYNKKYRSRKEYLKRFSIFMDNMKKVARLQETERGSAVYGATQFADLTEEEFRRNYLGTKPHLRQSNRRIKLAEIPKVQLEDSFDWRSYNVVTPVKNQGMCGSCWAFSVTGNIEGQWAIKHKSLLSLSEQELVDCDKLDQGCNGGYMTNAYEQIISLGGLESEADYPYDGVDEKCKLAPEKVEVTLSSYVNISQDETEMAQWLTANGPISIGINANAMQFYFGGVSHPWKFLCNPESIDHGVLIVGYGVSSYPLFHRTLPYWIVKNSWGEGWGEKGYYRVYRGDGTCGVNLMASSAVVD